MEDIFRAVWEGNEEEVVRLLDADPGLLERGDHSGDRPLAAAAEYGQLGVVRLLMERGASINATGHGGRTALRHAAADGNEAVLALLLDEGAHTNTRDNNGMTPLMWACASGHLGVVKMLVQHMGGQGLEERSNRGSTALHYAADGGPEEMVRFLLVAGADPTITDSRGRTPRALAEENHSIVRIREGRERCVDMFQVRLLTC
jgi:ankyrin repeat protein